MATKIASGLFGSKKSIETNTAPPTGDETNLKTKASVSETSESEDDTDSILLPQTDSMNTSSVQEVTPSPSSFSLSSELELDPKTAPTLAAASAPPSSVMATLQQFLPLLIPLIGILLAFLFVTSAEEGGKRGNGSENER
jgi:hypothetical protein